MVSEWETLHTQQAITLTPIQKTMNLWYKVSFMLVAALLLLPACGSAQHVVTDIEETFQGIEEIIVTGGSLEVSYEGAQKEDLFLNAYLESNRKDGPEITYKQIGRASCRERV